MNGMDIPAIPDAFWDELEPIVVLDEPREPQEYASPLSSFWPVSPPMQLGETATGRGLLVVTVPSSRFEVSLDPLSNTNAGSKLKDLVVLWNTGKTTLTGRGISW